MGLIPAAAGDAAESDVADDQQVGMDLLGQVHQRVDGDTDDRLLLHVLGPGPNAQVEHSPERTTAGGVGPSSLGVAGRCISRASAVYV
jgi:hypothetical protein